MQPYDFEASLGYWLTLTAQAYHRQVAERLAPQGITYRQSHVVGWLALCGELSQAELASRMMIEPPTLVRLLDRMESAGLIRRDGDPHDRRRRIVRLTPAAEPVWEQITRSARQVRQLASQGLSAAEVTQLRSLLERVSTNLGAERPVPNTRRPRAALAEE